MLRSPSAVLALALALPGCESGEPMVTPGPDAAPRDAGALDGALVPLDAASSDAGSGDAGASSCEPAATDYQPRVAMSAGDGWPACISDDGAYHMIDPAGLGAPVRVAAYEAIFDASSGPLRYAARDPSPTDFTAARTIYQEPNGLGTRVGRRADVHYPPVTATCTSGTTMLSGCQCPEAAAADPEACVGPATLLPIIQDAFRAGQTGAGAELARVHAARIRAALLWFLYASIYKETLTCSAGRDAKDCDSGWAKYTGQDESGSAARDATLGLSTLVRALEPETHERIWDGLLAVRCWRDLDRGEPAAGMPFGDATMPELRERARDQLDRALLRGMARVAMAELDAAAAATGAARDAHLAFVRTWLAPIDATTLEVQDETGAIVATYAVAARPSLFDRAVRAVSPIDADALAAATMAAEPDLAAARAILDRTFPCP